MGPYRFNILVSKPNFRSTQDICITRREKCDCVRFGLQKIHTTFLLPNGNLTELLPCQKKGWLQLREAVLYWIDRKETLCSNENVASENIWSKSGFRGVSIENGYSYTWFAKKNIYWGYSSLLVEKKWNVKQWNIVNTIIEVLYIRVTNWLREWR